MSNMINVDGSDDPSYRYKMPRLVSKVEGRGNGVKTVLVNCSEVAGALHRSAAQVTKFFGCELGAMTKYEEKIDRSLVNGSFDNKVLQEALTGYIQKFVLCPSCGNPETIQELKGKKKSALILLNCKACGANDEADNSHKLVTFIVKEMGPEENKSKKELRKKKRNERNNQKKNDNDSRSAEGSVTDGEKKKKKKKKKKDKERDKLGKEKKKKKERKRHKDEVKQPEPALLEENVNGGKENHVNEDNVDDVSSSDSDSGEGVTKSLGELTVHDIAALNTSVERIVEMIKNKEEEAKVIAAVEELQVNSGLRRVDRIPIMFFSVFNDSVPLQDLMTKLKWVKTLSEKVKDAFLIPADLEVEFLLCLEEGVVRIDEGEAREKVRKMVPVLLKLMYDEDLVEEKTVLDWFAGSLDPAKYKHVRHIVDATEIELIKKEAQPIIQWFNEAETDSSEEDE